MFWQESDKFTQSINDQAKSWETLKQKRDAKLQGDLAEISNTQAMIRELKTYVDESGKINEKKERAKWLIDQINQVMPNSIKLVDDEKVAWQMSTNEMVNYFEKKRAMAIQQANEEAYTTAIKNRSQAEKDAGQAYIDLMNQEERLKQAYHEKVMSYNLITDLANEQAYNKEKAIYDKKKFTYDTAETTLNDYYTTIQGWEENDIAIKSNNSQKIYEISKGVVDNFKTAKDSTIDVLEKQVAETGIQYGLLQQKVDNGVKGVTQTMVDEAGVNYQKAIVEYEKIGGAIPDGMQVGMENGKPTLKNKVVNFLASIKSWFTSKDTGFDTHSPSKWSEQIMTFVTDGMVIGLNNGKGEVMDTVDKLTSELKDRVSSALKGISNEYDNISLSYDLWEKTYGSTATEEEKQAKKAELLTKQMDAEQNKILILQTQYDSMAQQYGQQHELSIQANNDLIREQISMADLINQAKELNDTKEKNIALSKKAYDDYIAKNGARLKEQGVSQKDIQSAASRVSGYNPPTILPNFKSGISILDNAINNIFSKISGKSLTTAIPKLNYVATNGSDTSSVNNSNTTSNTNNKNITITGGITFNTTDKFNVDEFLTDLESVVSIMKV